MKNSHLVSIVMPVRNAAPYLRACLDSIVQQSYAHWELWAADDHSSDESFEILSKYSKQDSRIHAISNLGRGIIHALQTAYQHCLGELITRMDADDSMTTTRLESMVHRLVSIGKGHVAVGYVEYFAEGQLGAGYKKYAHWLNDLTAREANFSEIYKECVVPSPCWMVWRKDFESCQGFTPERYPEDYDLCFRFYRAGYKIAGIPEILHRWRDYPDRTSRTHEHYADNRFLELKLSYFLNIDHDTNKQLMLWGAGDKGKNVARQLNKKQINFLWVSNNKKKIGHEIHGRNILSPQTIDKNISSQIIILVANPKEQLELLDKLKKYENVEVFLFC